MVTVIFDGVCSLCNSSVDFLIRHDVRRTMRFVSFQDGRLPMLLPDVILPSSIDTILVVVDGKVLDRSNAVLHLAAELPFPWKLLAAARIVPRPLRDGIYKVIAAHRYRWFGKKPTCRIPLPHERDRFL
jgi:predicted DCC family thiol-disulfide oxidoreductase YuxK